MPSTKTIAYGGIFKPHETKTHETTKKPLISQIIFFNRKKNIKLHISSLSWKSKNIDFGGPLLHTQTRKNW